MNAKTKRWLGPPIIQVASWLFYWIGRYYTWKSRKVLHMALFFLEKKQAKEMSDQEWYEKMIE